MDNVAVVKDLKTTKRFPPSLRGTIYEAMLDAVSEEISVWRAAIEEQKTSFYDIDKVSDERLAEISKTFGVPLNLWVKEEDNREAFLREEVRAIPFKLYYKGTPTLYKSFFYAVGRYGEMFSYIYRADGNNIFRRARNPFGDAISSPMNLPVCHRSENDFSGHIQDWLTLDSDLYLDSGDTASDTGWTLDISLLEITINHLGFEYFIDRIIERKNANSMDGEEAPTEYLMTKEYLDYMNQSINFARRVKEVPHIGSQLSIQTKANGICNAYAPNEVDHPDNLLSEYTVPSLKLKAVTRENFFKLITSINDITHVEFGTGRQEVPSIQEPKVVFPEKLASRVCTFPVLSKNRFEDERYLGIIGKYQGQSLSKFEILGGAEFDGKKQEFLFTLPLAPIQKGNISLDFHLPTGEILPITDNRQGLFLSLYGNGTINYATGECELSTKFNYSQVDTIEQITQLNLAEGKTRVIHTLNGEGAIAPESVWITFTLGEGAGQRTYAVKDEPDTPTSITGTFLHDSIVHGTINYSTKVIDITFKDFLVPPSVRPFTCKYSFLVDYTLPEGTVLLASYYFTQQVIPITEAGFRNKEGVLLSYATFPPFEFSSADYHLHFMLLVKKLDAG